MPDPNLSPMQALQQSEMLREIRDELRMSRMSGGGSPGSTAMGGGPKPGSSYVHAQIAADRALVGEWGSLGWSHAYSPTHNTSMLTDAMAMAGLVRAPNTMFQSEYQEYAGQSLGSRIATMPGRLIAPGFMGRSDHMAATMSAFSPRFSRYGDQGTGPLGFGMSQLAANRFGRESQAGASRDMLLSGKDYNSVFDTGASSGQFDFAKTTGDLAKTFAELRTATADLTRSMKMSVDEVGQTLGALRQYGVKDVGDQYRTAQQINASARISGLSNQEMMSITRQAIEGGLASGVGAMGSAGVAGLSTMDMRSMSRDGIISTAVTAAGGGTTAMGNAMTQAKLGFAGSNLGYYAARGGAGDFFGALGRGIGGAGSLNGYMAAEAGRIDFLSKRSGSQIDGDFDRFIGGQLGMMGYSDGESDDAQNMAMQLAMANGMDSPTALAFGRGRGTTGRRNSARNRYLAKSFESDQAGKQLLDNMYLNTSGTGRMRQTMGAIGGGIADAINGVGDFVSPGASGYFGSGGSLQTTRMALATGSLHENLSLGEFAKGMGGSATSTGATGRLAYSPGFGGAAGTLLGGASGGAAAVGTIALLGSNPLGWAALTTGVVATVAGGAFGSSFNASPRYVADSSTMMRAQDALANPSRYGASARIALTTGTSAGNGALANNALFQGLAASSNRGSMTGDQAESLVATAKVIARQTNMSVETVMAALPMAGVDLKMPNTYMHIEGMSGSADAMLDQVAGGLSEAGGVLAKTSGRGAVADLSRAIAKGDGAGIVNARVALAEMGIKGSDLNRLVSNTRGLGKEGQTAFASGLDTDTKGMRDVAFYRAYSPTVGMLRDTANDLSSDDTTKKRFQGSLSAYESDPARLVRDAMTGSLSGDVSTLLKNSPGLDKVLRIGSFKGGTADDIVKEFFGGHANMTAVAEGIVQQSAGMSADGVDNGKIKKALALSLLNPGQYESPEDTATNEARKSAQLLGDAAIVMREVCQKLGIKGTS